MTQKMVKVEAVKPVRNDGVSHAPGETFEMEQSLVGPHAAAGQVKVLDGPPADKQARPAKNK